ncbi:MAG TPA: GYF domain-containing protein [Candidatus Binatia bacterium]
MDWYISKQGVKEGPYSDTQIQALLQEGHLAPNHLAWRFGLAGWTPIRKLSELRGSAPSHAESAHVFHLVTATETDRATARLPERASLKTRRDSYCARHWRGELSLPVSLWINGNLISLVLAALVMAVAATDAVNEMPRWFAGGGVAYWLLLVVMTVWQLIGVWRSAGRYLAAGKSKCWGRLALAMVILGLIASIFSLSTVGVPQTMEFAQLALGRDPIGSYQLRVLRNATALEVSGAIIFGLTDEVAKTLDGNPEVKILHLNSHGGRVGEARRLRNLIATRKLATFTAAGCFSACTLAYAAGERRLIGRNASLGFHQYAFPGVQQSAFRRQYEKDKNDWLARGIDRAFVERAYATAHNDLWRPEHPELFAARFVTGYPDSNAVAMSGILDEQSAKLEAELSKHVLFAALKKHEPGVYRRVVAELENGLKGGRSETELREILSPLAQSVYRKKLPHASNIALLGFTDLFIEQTQALYNRDPALCYQYVYEAGQGGGAEINKSFSQELKEKEMLVLVEVIRSAAAQMPPAPAQEQVQQQLKAVFATLTERHGKDVALLTNPARGKSDPAKMCVLTRELYQNIRKLPEEQSAMVLRFMFANAK